MDGSANPAYIVTVHICFRLAAWPARPLAASNQRKRVGPTRFVSSLCNDHVHYFACIILLMVLSRISGNGHFSTQLRHLHFQMHVYSWTPGIPLRVSFGADSLIWATPSSQLCHLPLDLHARYLELARTIYIYGAFTVLFGKESTKYTVIYGVYIYSFGQPYCYLYPGVP